MILVYGQQIVSVIDNPEDPDSVIVRAMTNTDIVVLFPGEGLETYPQSDWPFRTVVARAHLAERMAAFAKYAGGGEPKCRGNSKRKAEVIEAIRHAIAKEYGPLGLGTAVPDLMVSKFDTPHDLDKDVRFFRNGEEPF